MQSQCLVDYDPRIATPEQLRETLQASGYSPTFLYAHEALKSPRASPKTEEIEALPMPPTATPSQGKKEPGQNLQRQNLKLEVEGMTCSACVGAVESAAKSVKGVEQVSVNLMTGQVCLGSTEAVQMQYQCSTDTLCLSRL
jgi:copper chaperone CopZ